MIEGQAGQGQCTQMKLYTRIAATYWEQQIHAVRERRAAYLSCDCITLTKKNNIYKQTGWLAQAALLLLVVLLLGRATSLKVLHKCMERSTTQGRGKEREAERHCIQLTV